MTRQEQIEEMGKTMCEEFRTNLCGNECECANEFIAEKLYSAGYRKASDVIDEFVERFINAVTISYQSSTNKDYYEITVDKFNKILDEMRQEVEK